MKKLILLTLVLLAGSGALAAQPSMTNLTQDDFDNITKEFSSNFAHPAASGASTLGDVFGFEVSLLAGQTPSPEIDKIAKRTSSDGFPNLYHAGLLVAVSVPFGLTGEVVYTPKYSANDTSFNATSLGLKWTFSENLLVIPFNSAIRVFQTTSNLNFKQSSSGVDGTVENKNTVNGVQLVFSPRLPMVEPYAGVGYLQAKNTLSFTGTGTIFNNAFTRTESADSSRSSTQVLAGVNLYALLFSLGLEYSKAFDTNRYTAKLGFAF